MIEELRCGASVKTSAGTEAGFAGKRYHTTVRLSHQRSGATSGTAQ
jgi:hypothetical protein